MFYKNQHRNKSLGDMDKDPFSWKKIIPITVYNICLINLSIIKKLQLFKTWNPFRCDSAPVQNIFVPPTLKMHSTPDEKNPAYTSDTILDNLPQFRDKFFDFCSDIMRLKMWAFDFFKKDRNWPCLIHSLHLYFYFFEYLLTISGPESFNTNISKQFFDNTKFK